MDSFSKLSNLFVQRNSFWEIYEEFQRDVLELTLHQKRRQSQSLFYLQKSLQEI